MFNRVPTVNRIASWLDVDTEASKQIRGLLKGDISPDDNLAVDQWLRQCFNRPSDKELVLCAVNDLMNGHGVEVIRGRWVDNYYGDTQAEYINTGDSYDGTLLHDTETGNIVLATVGDWVESKSKSREIQ